MAKESKEQSFALCIENTECADLEKRKIYKVLPAGGSLKAEGLGDGWQSRVASYTETT